MVEDLLTLRHAQILLSYPSKKKMAVSPDAGPSVGQTDLLRRNEAKHHGAEDQSRCQQGGRRANAKLLWRAGTVEQKMLEVFI